VCRAVNEQAAASVHGHQGVGIRCRGATIGVVVQVGVMRYGWESGRAGRDRLGSKDMVMGGFRKRRKR
jgi:hypothetical protein